MYLLLNSQIDSRHILLLETRSKQFGSRSTTTKVVSRTSPWLLLSSCQTWYPELLWFSMKDPILLPCQLNLLVKPIREPHPLLQNQTIKLAARIITDNPWLGSSFREGFRAYNFIEKKEYYLKLLFVLA